MWFLLTRFWGAVAVATSVLSANWRQLDLLRPHQTDPNSTRGFFLYFPGIPRFMFNIRPKMFFSSLSFCIVLIKHVGLSNFLGPNQRYQSGEIFCWESDHWLSNFGVPYFYPGWMVLESLYSKRPNPPQILRAAPLRPATSGPFFLRGESGGTYTAIHRVFTSGLISEDRENQRSILAPETS